MKKVHANDLKEWCYEGVLPAELNIRESGLDRKLIIEGSHSSSVKADITSFNSFLITHLDLALDEDTPLEYKGSGPTMGLYFNLNGSCSFGITGRNTVIASGQQNIYFSSSFDERLTLHPEGGKFENLEINFPVSYYTNLLSGHSTLQDKFINQILSGKQHFIQLGILPMSLPVKWIINTIRKSTRTGVLKRLFLESKILELLMLQVEQMEKLTKDDNDVFTKHEDIDLLMEAKEIIDRNLDNPPTIRALAKQIGMNEFNLKKGFKEKFGITIFNYASKMKMEQARQMILEGEKSITEISTITGYRNPQHFTAAFKKLFGMLPSKLRIVPFIFCSLLEQFIEAERLLTFM